MFDIFADFRERACVWQNKEFHKRAWCVSAFAREEERVRDSETDNEERTHAARESECEERFSI